MRRSRINRLHAACLGVSCLLLTLAMWPVTTDSLAAARDEPDQELREQLDAPLLFVKRHNYQGVHIYDTYYQWRPGGGIYIIDNPSAPQEQQVVRPLIDATTPATLGDGVYSDPELSWDAERVLFCYKGTPEGSTSIYEIGIDGSGLRRLSDPSPYCVSCKSKAGGQHDVGPAYLPDGRIVFTSTRLNGLVPCNNTGVDILHVMDADGTNVHPISVNNVNEFDPCVLPDGRILHGRWEYVDKTALTQQSLWTIFPDGTNETAQFANNMVHPEALLDARPVPGAHDLVVGSLTRHNGPPRGTVAFVDARLGKNSARAITNLDQRDNPTHDMGDSCEPWPLSKDVVLYSGKLATQKYNAIMMTDRDGRRVVVHADSNIDCHSPMLIQPRERPPVLASNTDPDQATGRFFIQDIYQGLTGVERGEVKWLRAIEETSRASASPGGAFNQTFLVSGVLAFSVKNFLGVVPVEEDGSAYFEVPSGRAVYLQALDAEGRLVQSMRTFVQAAPGVTRSCIGCHEHKSSTPSHGGFRLTSEREPVRLQEESWGSGFIDFPTMVQPILDQHCVSCHGGEKGIDARLDLTGGWTEFFSISYENLISRRKTQLTAHLIAGIDCMNGTSQWSAQILPPRSHGSGAAPLADLLVSGHGGRIPDLSRKERDLILAWIDTNGLFHGTWNYSEHGCNIKAWAGIEKAVAAEMDAAGCMRCHGDGKELALFEDDWINLQHPEQSRILRAPLAKGKDGAGLAWCRDQKVDPLRQRLRILFTGSYLHGDLPLEAFKPVETLAPAPEGEPVVTYESTDDPHYQNMLAIIRDGRRQALAEPRVDMPGAKVIAGLCRQLKTPPLPDKLPRLQATSDADGMVRLSWQRSAKTIGLTAELHRAAQPDFTPSKDTLVATTRLFEFVDVRVPSGEKHYALVFRSDEDRSEPARAAVMVKPAIGPAPP